jgi:hypothetical protein
LIVIWRNSRKHLTTLFRAYGLPERMLMDNGSPWGDELDTPDTLLTIWQSGSSLTSCRMVWCTCSSTTSLQISVGGGRFVSAGCSTALSSNSPVAGGCESGGAACAAPWPRSGGCARASRRSACLPLPACDPGRRSARSASPAPRARGR